MHDQVSHRVRAEFDDLGQQAVKNIAAPVHVYRVRLGTASPAEPITRRPNSIAVLAFDNMSADPTQQAFCDGISEDIITDLSKISGIAGVERRPGRVVARGEAPRRQWDDAVRNAELAVELNPLFPLWYRYLIGAARHFGDRDREALPILQTVKSANPRLIPARLAMIASEMALDRRDEASAEALAIVQEPPDACWRERHALLRTAAHRAARRAGGSATARGAHGCGIEGGDRRGCERHRNS
ncbi:MAG: hypothetical protein ACT4P4_22260 [Betaproteobacteria bacterium]